MGYFTDEQRAAVPQHIVNQYAANGRDLGYFTDEQRAAIPQEFINQYAENGGFLSELTKGQKSAIPQEFINQRAANGGDLRFFTKAQIAAIPQEIIKQYIVNGGPLIGLTDAWIAAIPQDIINKRVANGGYLYDLTEAQIAAIPQEIINQYVANRGNCDYLTEAQRGAIPYQILYDVSKEVREALVLYAAGKITSSELPADVYANYKARKSLLEIIKHKTMNEFVAKCERAGYDRDTVPAEIKQAFDEKLAGIEKEVKAKMIEAVKELTYPAEHRQKEKDQKGQELEKVVVEKTKQDLWSMFKIGVLRFETAKKLLGDDPDFADRAFEIEKDKIMAEFRALKQKGKVTRAVADEYKQRLQDVIDMIFNSNSGNADDGPKFSK